MVTKSCATYITSISFNQIWNDETITSLRLHSAASVVLVVVAELDCVGPISLLGIQLASVFTVTFQRFSQQVIVSLCDCLSCWVVAKVCLIH